MKQCSKCLGVFESSSFFKDKRTKTGLYSSCRKCHNKWQRRSKDSQYTINSLLINTWKRINSRSKIGNYKNVKVLISKERFFEKFNNLELQILFEKWLLSGKQRMYVPSIDRIDNNGNYEESNMQWITFSENARKDKLGKRKKNREIIQYSMEGLRLNTFTSTPDASLAVCGHQLGFQNILSCAKGKIPSAYGYKWKIVDKDLLSK